MRSHWWGLFVVAGIGVAGAAVARPATAYGAPAARAGRPGVEAAQRLAKAAYGKLPMSFEPNRGQVHPDVKFLTRGNGYTLFLTPTEAVMALVRPERRPAAGAERTGEILRPADPKVDVLRMKLDGANPQPRVSGAAKLPGISNYLIGDQKNWRSEIPTFGRVQYQAVYPGVDMVCYGKQRQVEYDFIVAPGADPKQIRLAFTGAKSVSVDAAGDLLLRLPGGVVRQHRPVVYQTVNGARKEVAGKYVLLPSKKAGARKVGFELAAYDASRPLVIDPIISYSTFLGGSGDDQGNAVAVDAFGNTYVTGSTVSANYPLVGPIPVDPFFTRGTSLDVFITKINAAGTAILYSSVLGGSYHEVGLGVAVDVAGKAYITGYTTSFRATAKFDKIDLAPYPVFNQIQPNVIPDAREVDENGNVTVTPLPSPAGGRGDQDAFLSIMSPTGATTVLSTYLGGGSGDIGNAIAVDRNGAVYITGTTISADDTGTPAYEGFFGTSGSVIQGQLNGGVGTGVEDAFAIKINPALQQVAWATYLGGSFVDFGTGIAVDFNTSEVYLTGTTGSTNFPGAAGSSIQPTFGGGANRFGGDAYVSKIDGTGSRLVYSSYLGGAAHDHGTAVAVDEAGNAYVTGSTVSTNFPIFQPKQNNLAGLRDAFVTEVNPTGTGLVYSTYLGGSRDDVGLGIQTNGFQNAYVTGFTLSPDFPTQLPIQSFNNGADSSNGDAFLVRYATNGVDYIYSTYLGGSAFEQGNGIDVDASGNAYIIGFTSSTDLPLVSALQGQNLGGNQGFDAFLAKVSSAPAPPTNLRATPTSSTEVLVTFLDNSSDESRFEIERRTAGTDFVKIGEVGANVTRFTDVGLTPGATYIYRVRVVNNTNDAAFSNTATSTLPLTPVAAPSGLTAQVVSPSLVRLTWVDNGSTEAKFEIERRIGNGGFVKIAEVAANTTTFDDRNLPSNTTFTYRVRAIGADNSASAFTDEATVSTPLNPPAAPNGLQAAAESSTTVRIVFTDRSDNESNFRLERSLDGVTFTPLATIPGNSTSNTPVEFTDTGLAPLTRYVYRIQATNADGTSTFSTVASAITNPELPAAPSDLTVSVTGSNRLALAWRDNSDNETSFVIQRSVAGGAFTDFRTVGADITTFTDTTVSPGTTYAYRVRANNGSGRDSEYSNTAQGTPRASSASLPAAPASLKASAGSTGQLKLTWKDLSRDETGFKVERRSGSGSFTVVVTLKANVRSFTDSKLAAKQAFTYRVFAYNAAGESAPSNEASATTPGSTTRKGSR